MENKLALCIPTYNRPAIIQELCEQSILQYLDFGMDIYIYDSSEDDRTKDIVSKYQSEYSHLFYCRIDSSVHSNEKVYMILQKNSYVKEYEYIWICGDALRYSTNVLSKIGSAMNQKFDFIIVDAMDDEKIGSKEYTKKNEFFHDCAWYMTLYGATLIRTETVLRDADWKFLIEKYLGSDTLYYSQVGFYFEQLAKLDTFHAIHIAKEHPHDMWTSVLKKRSGWYEQSFDVICKNWVNTIYALPDIYTAKQEVARKLGNYTIFKDVCLLDLKENHIYTLKTFFQHFSQFKYVTDHSRLYLFLTAVMPKQFTPYVVCTKHVNRNMCKKMKRFAAGYEHIFLYGAGIYGKYYAENLEKSNIHFTGFAVTNQTNMDDQYLGKPVYSLEEVLERYPQSGFILSVSDRKRDEITKYLADKVKRESVFEDSLIYMNL